MSVTPGEFPELDEDDPRRYRMNMDWVWSDVHNRGLRKQATVRATVAAPDHEGLIRRFDAWTAQLQGQPKLPPPPPKSPPGAMSVKREK